MAVDHAAAGEPEGGGAQEYREQQGDDHTLRHGGPSFAGDPEQFLAAEAKISAAAANYRNTRPRRARARGRRSWRNGYAPRGGAGWWAALAAAGVWGVCLWRFGLAHPAEAGMATGGAAYSVALAACAWLLVRRPAGRERLDAGQSRAEVWVWWAVAVATLAWAVVYGVAFGGAAGGWKVPGLTDWIAGLMRWWPAPGIDGTSLLNLTSLGLVPAAALLLAGARPGALGLAPPLRGTLVASLVCLALPAAMVGRGLAVGKVAAGAVVVMGVHSAVSNGFCEELMCRGLLLPTLRASLPTAWAVVGQGLVFGLVHAGGAVAEEGGDVALAAAAAVALNFSMGVALGVLAVRTGSLALPVAVHISLHLMKGVLAG